MFFVFCFEQQTTYGILVAHHYLGCWTFGNCRCGHFIFLMDFRQISNVGVTLLCVFRQIFDLLHILTCKSSACICSTRKCSTWEFSTCDVYINVIYIYIYIHIYNINYFDISLKYERRKEKRIPASEKKDYWIKVL